MIDGTNMIDHSPNAINFRLQQITWLQKFGRRAGKTDAAGCAGGNNIAWLKRHATAKNFDERWQIKN